MDRWEHRASKSLCEQGLCPLLLPLLDSNDADIAHCQGHKCACAHSYMRRNLGEVACMTQYEWSGPSQQSWALRFASAFTIQRRYSVACFKHSMQLFRSRPCKTQILTLMLSKQGHKEHSFSMSLTLAFFEEVMNILNPNSTWFASPQYHKHAQDCRSARK